MPALGNVIFFLIFTIILFSILGLQLFSGIYYNRCRISPLPINGIWEIDPNITKLCDNLLNPCPNKFKIKKKITYLFLFINYSRWCGNILN
jgi:hypothetical protein